MKNSKRMLCLILAIVVMLGSMGLVSAFAETQSSSSTSGTTEAKGTTVTAKHYKSNSAESKYFVKFTKEMLQAPKFLTCDEMTVLYGEDPTKAPTEFAYGKDKTNTIAGANVSVNDDNSITLSKSGTQYGANLEIPVTDDMKAAYLNANNKELLISYYLTKANISSGTFKDYFSDCQFRIYAKFKDAYTVDNTSRYIKLTTLGKNSYNCYQQVLNKSFKIVDDKDQPLENLDNVESLIICLYNFRDVEASMEVSSILIEGEPAIKSFVSPTPEAVGTTVSATDWSKGYAKDNNDTPSPVKYSPTASYNSRDYKSTGRVAGWANFKTVNAISSKQINLEYYLDVDAFNKAVVTANQSGGSHKFTITGMFPKIEDTTGKSMPAEFQIQLFKYDGTIETPVQEWVQPGKEFTFEVDTTNITVNSIRNIKLGLMAFWYYDADEDKFYDSDKAKKYDKDGNLLTPKYTDDEDKKFLGYDNGKGGALLQNEDIAKYLANCSDGRKDVDITDKIKSGKLKLRTMQNVEGFISPLYAGASQAPTPTQATTQSTSGNGDYEYAGYHFYDFTEEAYSEFYGLASHASFVKYFYDGYYNQYEVLDKNFDTDGTKQGYKSATPTKVNGDANYIKEYGDAKNLVSGGYQFELNSPYPRNQVQHQAMFYIKGSDEDKDRMSTSSEHKSMPAQNEKYNFTEQMANAIKYAKENPDPTKKGYLAIDVYVANSVHGYKNTYNSTYKAWCQKNGKTAQNEKSPIEVQVMLFASVDGQDATVRASQMLPVGEKKTLYLDVSELEASNISDIRISAHNYANLANKEQGGDNKMCGVTDVEVKYSAIYVPGNKNTDLTTTKNVTRPFSAKDAKKIKKLYDALPGLKVSDYKTMADYKKLSAFIKAWTKASPATQKYCEEKYGIDYSKISMLEADVYDKLFGSGSGDADGDGNGTSPGTGDIAFPMLSLVVAGLAGYVIVKTRKKKSV